MIGIGKNIFKANVKAGGGAVVYDTDAQAFFTAANITDTTQKNAVNQLVLDLKTANIWTKMKALYPVVGGVASSHAVNLKTPGTYNLTFATGWTHSNTGMTPSNAYANTFLKPFSNLTSMNNHISYYSRTNTTFAYDNGISDEYLTSGKSFIVTFNHGVNTSKAFIQCLDPNAATGAETNTLGFIMGSRTSTTSLKLYRNGTLKGTNSTSTSISLPNENCFLGALYYRDAAGTYGVAYGNKQCAFASIGDGLTDAEASSFYTAIQTFQTTLGRQV